LASSRRLAPAAPARRPATGPARPRTKGTAIARIDDLMDTVDSKFHLVHLAAKRAREINEYYGQLGEGLGQHVPPLVVTESNKPLSIALEEIAQGKIVVTEASELEGQDPLDFMEGEVEDAEA
jgi:DNA-directed RNA polymerase subunit omega